jgi:aryl-alcohol dehydrogenase-like predicted oxidoreductase
MPSAIDTTVRRGTKLALGGHSFIAELGNDSPASDEEQRRIVAACLDAGITLFDTTYYQERVALGAVLGELGRRDDAELMAWNFFKTPGREQELVRFAPYAPGRLEETLAELRTDRLDVLVVHAIDDQDELDQQLQLAASWVADGRVGEVALGMATRERLDRLPPGHPVRQVLAPYNAFNRDAASTFARARELGLETVALSPFVRGWKLDAIEDAGVRAPELLLRWVTSQDIVDRVVVSMRRAAWVEANLAAEARGPLDAAEQRQVDVWSESLGR